MKRSRDDEEASNASLSMPGMIKVPPPSMPRTFAFDERGVETFVARTAPVDVQNATNKQVFREKEWAKNVMRNELSEAEMALEHLDEDDKQVVRLISYAHGEMQALAHFGALLAAGERMQVDYVPHTLPLEPEEVALRAGRLEARQTSLKSAGARLREAAARCRQGSADDVHYYADLRSLRRNWVLQIVGGARFAAVLSVTHSSAYGGLTGSGEELRSLLTRSPRDGSVELRIPSPLRPRFLVNETSSWPLGADGGVARGAKEVHMLLLEASRSLRSKLGYNLMSSSVASTRDLMFCSVRDQGSAIVLELLISAFKVDSFVFSLGQPKVFNTSMVEFLVAHFLCVITHQQRLGDVVFGKPNEYLVGIRSKFLAHLGRIAAHLNARKEASAACMASCQANPGLSFIWSGTDVQLEADNVTSNALVFSRSRQSNRAFFSLSNVGAYRLNGLSRPWGLSECVESILMNLKIEK